MFSALSKVSGLLFILLAVVASLPAQEPAPEDGGESVRDIALQPITDTPGLPRVLIIGDSISIGYTIPVRAQLKDRANVHRVPANATSTKNGLRNLGDWLGTEKWEVIHFNWGLHDLKYLKDRKKDLTGEQFVPPAIYGENLRKLVQQLKATGAKLIWASTTPVPEGTEGRIAGDEIEYNKIAAAIMEEQGIPIDDLYAAVKEKQDQVQRPKNVHFTVSGYQYLGDKVASSIAEHLPSAAK